MKEAIEAEGVATITAPEIFYDSDTDLYISTSQTPSETNIELKSGQTVSFNISTGQPVIPVTVPPSQKLEYTVYGVDIDLIIEPGVIVLNEEGYTGKDTTFRYTILPNCTPSETETCLTEDGLPKAYNAIMADIDLYEIDENGVESWVGYLIGDNTQGEGTAIAVTGSLFDITKRYEAEVVLNRGSDVEIRGERVELIIAMVEFVEDTTQSYGFDNYTNPDIPWKSVETANSTDTAKAEITPAEVSSKVYLKSTVPANVTVSPNQASSSTQIVTVTGIAKGNSDIQANIGSENGQNAATMKVTAYNAVTKTLAIILVHEDNDDVQVIPVGSQGQPYQICVSAGANAKRDTGNVSGDDTVNGEDITTGADGICDTVANNNNIMSTDINEVTLKTFLNNTIYNQAVVYWDKVDRRPDCTVNFDLNKDGELDVDSWMSPEMQVIRDQCGDSDYNYNIFLIDNPSDGSTGFMRFNQRYGFVHVANSSEPYRTTAHELGHGAFGLQHILSDSENIMYNYSSTTKWRLRKNQWDDIHNQ